MQAPYYIEERKVKDIIYERMISEYEKIKEQILELEKQLVHFPEGKLIYSRTKEYCKWYVSDGKNKTYIPQKNYELVEQLAIKKYISSQLEDLLYEKRAIEFYLRHHTSLCKSTQLFAEDSVYRKILEPYFTPLSKELYDWMNAPYKSNPSHPENKIHKGISGHFLRSKSETLIEMVLYMNKIPYRYENLLELEGTELYPDFTIRHPRKGDWFYWEHFGLMDNPAYVANAFSKQKLYAAHGIIPTINLITTYETLENPLTVETINKIVQEYFLD